MRNDVAGTPHRTADIAQSRTANGDGPAFSWIILAGLTLLAFIFLWFYGLAQKALTSASTHITACIGLIYFAACLHCLWRALAISRETAAGRSLAQAIVSATPLALAADDPRNAGLVAAHIRNLATKSALTPEDRRLDQTILLPSWPCASVAAIRSAHSLATCG
jgi:hypothetical protein